MIDLTQILMKMLSIVTSGRSANKKKKSDNDEKLEKIVNELKELHEQQYTPMQYRIWGEMIIGGLYLSKTKAPNTSMFSRAGGKEPKKKSEVVEALDEVAKHLSSGFAGVVPSGKHASTSTSYSVVASPAKSIDNWSKCYKQLGDLSELRSSGVLTEEYLHEKEAIMITLKKLYSPTVHIPAARLTWIDLVCFVNNNWCYYSTNKYLHYSNTKFNMHDMLKTKIYA